MDLKRARGFRLAVVVATVAVVSLPSQAHAYLDAGSASMIFQATVGAVAAALVVAKVYWQRIKSALGFAKSEPEADEQSDE